jgi:hypothetical protein
LGRGDWVGHTGSMAKEEIEDLLELEILHRLPNDAALLTDEAAAILRRSPSSLERMRKNGSGPAYSQGGEKGARGTNQKCTYLKGDLIQWQKDNRVASSMAAAVRRAQAYVPYVDPTPRRSSYDLVTKRPFYIDSSGLVAGAFEQTDVDVVIRRLGSWRIDWLNPIAASDRLWSSIDDYREFAIGVRSALQKAVETVSESLKNDVAGATGHRQG